MSSSKYECKILDIRSHTCFPEVLILRIRAPQAADLNVTFDQYGQRDESDRQ